MTNVFRKIAILFALIVLNLCSVVAQHPNPLEERAVEIIEADKRENSVIPEELYLFIDEARGTLIPTLDSMLNQQVPASAIEMIASAIIESVKMELDGFQQDSEARDALLIYLTQGAKEPEVGEHEGMKIKEKNNGKIVCKCWKKMEWNLVRDKLLTVIETWVGSERVPLGDIIDLIGEIEIQLRGYLDRDFPQCNKGWQLDKVNCLCVPDVSPMTLLVLEQFKSYNK